MLKFITWLLGGGISTIATTATQITKSVSDTKIASLKASTDTHKIDAEAETERHIEDAETNRRFGELNATVALEDSKHRLTRWMRPTAFAIAIYIFVCVAVQYCMPRLAVLLWIDVKEMPWPYNLMAPGIIAAVLVMRPWEKKKSGENLATMQATIANTRR